MCNDDERKKCEEEYGALLVWTCENCPRKKAEDISAYTWKLIRVYNLQKAGYPISADDLELEEWMDLGRIRAYHDMPFCPLMGSKKED